LRDALLAPRCSRNLHFETGCFRQAVDERKQQCRGVFHLAFDRSVLASAYNQMHVRRARRKVLVDIAFSIRYGGDTSCRSQLLTGARGRVQPALRFLIAGDARTAWQQIALIAVPNFRIGQTDQRARTQFKCQSSVQKQAAQSSTFANRPVSVRPRPPTPEGQLAGILNDHYVAPRDPAAVRLTAWNTISSAVTASLCRKRQNCTSRARLPARRLIQEQGRSTREACKATPLFPGGGRRTAPVRIRSTSLSPANHNWIHGISRRRFRQLRCVHTIVRKSGERERNACVGRKKCKRPARRPAVQKSYGGIASAHSA